MQWACRIKPLTRNICWGRGFLMLSVSECLWVAGKGLDKNGLALSRHHLSCQKCKFSPDVGDLPVHLHLLRLLAMRYPVWHKMWLVLRWAPGFLYRPLANIPPSEKESWRLSNGINKLSQNEAVPEEGEYISSPAAAPKTESPSLAVVSNLRVIIPR